MAEEAVKTSQDTAALTPVLPVASVESAETEQPSKSLTRKRKWDQQWYDKGLCKCKAHNPIRKIGKSKLCEECHQKQVIRMRLRHQAQRQVKQELSHE